MSSTNENQLVQQYQKKTDKQHILDNPDTYIGSVEMVDANMWILDQVQNDPYATHLAEGSSNAPSDVLSPTNCEKATPEHIIKLKHIEYIPALYKLFDEGIVNARDHVVRMKQKVETNPDCHLVTKIEIDIDDTGIITIMNDGNGIDVAKHPEYNIWIPEMVFGHLRTSTNYNTEEKRIVGGKNGFGFKLVLIWSSYGRIETVDTIRGLKYVQEFKNNLSEIGKPSITKCALKKPYTKVSFRPDYIRLKIPNGLSEDMLSLMRKRVYDISAVTDTKVKVAYNQNIIPVKNFQQYVELYIGRNKRVYETCNERWEYAVAITSTNQFEQVSFVNGICTYKGGKHVDYILGQITRKLAAYIENKKKIAVNANTIKEQLILFLRCDIENPSFDSQGKEYMNTPSNRFGSVGNVTDSFIEKVAKHLGVMDTALQLTEVKERNAVARKTDGMKTRTVRGISNFMDANWSGTNRSNECTLILCEGLSALSGVVSGLSKEDRDKYGIYPLRGKVLNVRGETVKKISENREICDLKKILGLESGKTYSTKEDIARSLRYGRIIVMCDSDVDGIHIRGLLVNLFHCEWASLFQITGFLTWMNTPILRARKGQQQLVFYNENEFQEWQQSLPILSNGDPDIRGWNFKYLKGLGSSTSQDFKEYFQMMKLVNFQYTGTESDDIIDKIFNKKRSDERKIWLSNYNKSVYLASSNTVATYEDFVNKELIHFSVYDCERSIPNMVDGFKTSQRKILYCAFKRNLTSEVKVAQFSGYVSEHSCYHHGETSLNMAIIGMAQDYVGSNNINLLMPSGQFGSRLSSDSAASPRYIFTYLNSLTRAIFPEMDDKVLTYLQDDGIKIEPEFYVPILPMVLVNGAQGIGTGFSTTIPSFNPETIVKYLKNHLLGNGQTMSETDFIPYYETFEGTVLTVERIDGTTENASSSSRTNESSKYLIKGVYEVMNSTTIHITELPIGTMTMPYITFLEELSEGSIDKKGKRVSPVIKEFTSHCTEKNVDITITFVKAPETKEEIERILKLHTTIATTNMHLFDKDGKLRKYERVIDILEEFCTVRKHTYEKRKEFFTNEMRKQLAKVSNKARYIQSVLNGTIELKHKRVTEIDELLDGLKFLRLDGTFDYLVKLPMISVSKEYVERLMKEYEDTQIELEILIRTPIEQMWLSELTVFEEKYLSYRNKRRQEYSKRERSSVKSNSGVGENQIKKRMKIVHKK